MLDIERGEDDGDETGVGVTYKQLPQDVVAGDTLVLADGLILLDVVQVEGSRILTRVKVGGRLSNGKGINRQGGGLSASALTEKDREDIRLAAEIGADYMAVSFPKTAEDMDEARRLLREAGGEGALVAKIERAEAVENLDEIMDASDAVMVARGDLAVEIGDAALPGVQKKIIRKAREKDCVTIVATQMMESMIENPIPTRAEVLDVANAVLDGADAVMLSGETAVGRYPVKVVRAMDRVCRGAESHWRELAEAVERRSFGSRNEAIAKAAMYTANHLRVKALVAMTESGATVLWMSRIRSDLPVYALTTRPQTARRVNLYRGVHPVVITWNEEQGTRSGSLGHGGLAGHGRRRAWRQRDSNTRRRTWSSGRHQYAQSPYGRLSNSDRGGSPAGPDSGFHHRYAPDSGAPLSRTGRVHRLTP